MGSITGRTGPHDRDFGDDVAAVIAHDTWVTEWQYDHARPLLAVRADTLVWLDLPAGIALSRVVRRTLRRRRTRETPVERKHRAGALERADSPRRRHPMGRPHPQEVLHPGSSRGSREPPSCRSFDSRARARSNRGCGAPWPKACIGRGWARHSQGQRRSEPNRTRYPSGSWTRNWDTPACVSPVWYHLVSGARKSGQPARDRRPSKGAVSGTATWKFTPRPSGLLETAGDPIATEPDLIEHDVGRPEVQDTRNPPPAGHREPRNRRWMTQKSRLVARSAIRSSGTRPGDIGEISPAADFMSLIMERRGWSSRIFILASR